MGIISKYQILREPDGDYVKDFVPFKLFGSYYKMLDFFLIGKPRRSIPLIIIIIIFIA